MRAGNWFDRYGIRVLTVLAVFGVLAGTIYTGYQTKEELVQVRADLRRQAQMAVARKRYEQQQIQALVDSMNRADSIQKERAR